MEPYAFKKLGRLPRVKDPRDFQLGHIQAPTTIPSVYKPDSFFALSALMQGQSPECGGFSLAQLINYFFILRGSAPQTLSGSFDYAYEKLVDGVPAQEGTTIAAIAKAGQQTGSCLIDLFPNDGTNPNDAPTSPYSKATPAAISDAATRKLPSYFFLDDLSLAGIKQAIYQNGAAILEVEVGDEWWTAANGATSWTASDILPVRPPAEIVDGHFILCGAHDENYIYFVNSWSNYWGQNGFGFFGEDYERFITNGLTFKAIPASVQQALTAQQISFAQQILQDIEQALGLIKKEAGQAVAKVALNH